jgi:hypothetical protein
MSRTYRKIKSESPNDSTPSRRFKKNKSAWKILCEEKNHLSSLKMAKKHIVKVSS